MASYGGKRENAGRKKAAHTLEAEAARARIVQFVNDNLEPILNALLKKAKKGDVQAIKELFDRGYGRPPQALEVQHEVRLMIDV